MWFVEEPAPYYRRRQSAVQTFNVRQAEVSTLVPLPPHPGREREKEKEIRTWGRVVIYLFLRESLF